MTFVLVFMHGDAGIFKLDEFVADWSGQGGFAGWTFDRRMHE